MSTQKSLKKYLLLTIATGVVAIAPLFANAAEVQITFNGSPAQMDDKDPYLNELKENVRNIEVSPEFQTALNDLKTSTSACSTLEGWPASDMTGTFVIKKDIIAEDQGNAGPIYSVILNYRDVSRDSFKTPLKILTTPSIVNRDSPAEFYKKALAKVTEAAFINRLTCTRLVRDQPKKVLSSN